MHVGALSVGHKMGGGNAIKNNARRHQKGEKDHDLTQLILNVLI